MVEICRFWITKTLVKKLNDKLPAPEWPLFGGVYWRWNVQIIIFHPKYSNTEDESWHRDAKRPRSFASRYNKHRMTMCTMVWLMHCIINIIFCRFLFLYIYIYMITSRVVSSIRSCSRILSVNARDKNIIRYHVKDTYERGSVSRGSSVTVTWVSLRNNRYWNESDWHDCQSKILILIAAS